MMAVTDMGSGYEDRGICGIPWVRWRGYFIHTLACLPTNIHDIHTGNCYRLSIALPLIITTMGPLFLKKKDLLYKEQLIIIIKAYLHWAKANVTVAFWVNKPCWRSWTGRVVLVLNETNTDVHMYT